MVQLEVLSKKMGNEFGSRLGRETTRGNMFRSMLLWQAWYFGHMRIIFAGRSCIS